MHLRHSCCFLLRYCSNHLTQGFDHFSSTHFSSELDLTYKKKDASASAISPQTLLFPQLLLLLLLQAPGSVRLEPCLWLVGLKTPDIPLEPFRERLAKFLAPSAFISLNVSYGEPNVHTHSNSGDYGSSVVHFTLIITS